MKLSVGSGFALVAFFVAITGAEAGVLESKVAGVGANTWVKLDESPTGGRNSPIFFYEPTLKQFVLTGGTPGGTYANARRHFDTEMFDPVTGKWFNAYPPGAPYKNETGETDAPVIGGDGLKSLIVQDKAGVWRIAMFGSAYGTDSRAHFQWAYDWEGKKLYAYLWNRTVCYDPLQRIWEDTGAEPFSKGHFMVWGNMCYDPINKEILSIGGSSAERGGTPGTYVFSISTRTWKKLVCGSEAFRALYARAQELRRQAWALLSACRSRYFITDSDREAQVKLSERAAGLGDALREFATQAAADLQSSEAIARVRALKKVDEAQEKLKVVAPRLDGSVGADLIAEVKAVHDDVEAAELILAPEPPGRAHSQPAFDARSGKIVLFGGNGLDRCYADTWLYDPKTRSWEQRWPKVSPSPRAGHALVYLPRSGKIALAGGYTIDGWFREIPHQVWIYDVAQNEWKPLLSVPLGPRGKASPDVPAGGAGGNWSGGGSPWAGAVTEDDILVMVDTFREGRCTWACRVDTSAPAVDTKDLPGVPPGTTSFSRRLEEWEKVEPPEAGKVLAVLEKLPANVWTALKPPKGVDHRAWNTTAYDADRHQLVWWGGGHVTYMGTDVAHYSLRANRWTIGYAPDLPTEPTGGFYVKASLSFRDRPQVPVHAYQSYAYDPPSGKMFYLDRAYDVSTREWEPDPYPGLEARGAMHTLLETTPHGVVALSEKGLYRFVWQEKSWKKLPWNGPSFGSAWCDGHALCYDSKRDCLWMAHKNIFRYDMKTGTVEKLDVVRPKRLSQWALWREQVHIPEADLILLMRRFKAEDGRETNVAFDPESKKYYEVELEFEGGKPRELTWSAALHYDGKLGIAILHDGFSGVWALRFDRKSAKMREIVE